MKQAIDEGTYGAGLRLPGEHALVATYKASRVTVGRALRELQADGYVERRVGSGTYVRTEPSSQHYTFGLLIPQLGQTEIFEPICQGMVSAQQSQGHVLIWGRSLAGEDTTEAQARDVCQRLISNRISGVFFAPFEDNARQDAINRTITDILRAAALPTVLLDRDVVAYPDRSGFDVVGIDNRRAGYVVTTHLIVAGCRRIGYLGKPHLAPSCVARAAGYRDAVAAAADSLDKDAGFVETLNPLDVKRVLSVMDRHRPDGIVCSNDHTAAQLMRTFADLGIAVPGGVRLVAFDDVKYASLVGVPLTTIHQPCDHLGAAAIQAMIQRIQSPEMPARDILVNFRLVVRQSCGT
ncbi:MAG: LacI family DNA-binding transcriptional regulator [Terriglobia bacterium]